MVSRYQASHQRYAQMGLPDTLDTYYSTIAQENMPAGLLLAPIGVRRGSMLHGVACYAKVIAHDVLVDMDWLPHTALYTYDILVLTEMLWPAEPVSTL